MLGRLKEKSLPIPLRTKDFIIENYIKHELSSLILLIC